MQFSRCSQPLRGPPNGNNKDSAGRLLSRTVSSAVPSAARALTVVFGMGTGVAPGRIASRNP